MSNLLDMAKTAIQNVDGQISNYTINTKGAGPMDSTLQVLQAQRQALAALYAVVADIEQKVSAGARSASQQGF